MAVIWGVNGLCQAMFWPPLVRLMAENLNDDNYSTACVWVSVGSSFGTIGVYLACPLLDKTRRLAARLHCRRKSAASS